MSSVRNKISWSVYLLTGIVAIGIIMIGISSEGLYTLMGEPPLTLVAWLESHPYLQIGNLIISEPSSSLIIFLLAILYLRVAYLFFRGFDAQQSRLW